MKDTFILKAISSHEEVITPIITRLNGGGGTACMKYIETDFFHFSLLQNKVIFIGLFLMLSDFEVRIARIHY